jgi:D-serine deaminase-like pyridoxal phosphate-dependent protein
MFKARRSARQQATQAAQAATAANLGRATAGAMRLAPSSPGALDLTVVRPGRYVMTDRIGRQVGEIHGDHVIGFRSRYQGLQRSFPTLEEARAHVEQLWRGSRSSLAV